MAHHGTHMQIEQKWLDCNNNIKPNSRDENSENPSTFNAIVGILRHKLGVHDPKVFNLAQLNANKHLTNNGKYMTNEFDYEKYEKEYAAASFFEKIAITVNFKRSSDRFSHDETNGITSSSFYFMHNSFDDWEKIQHTENLDRISCATMQTFYRFYDVLAGIKYAKNPDNESPLTNIKYFAAQSCKSEELDARGNYTANGKIQAWIRLNGLLIDDAFGVCTALLPEKNKWIEVFQNYFPEHDHPINVMARLLYKNKVVH